MATHEMSRRGGVGGGGGVVEQEDLLKVCQKLNTGEVLQEAAGP